MPIELIWLIPNKILLSRWTGRVEVDDMRVLIEELLIIFDEAPTVIHTVLDMSNVEYISSDAFYLYLQSPAARHARRGRIGLVQPSFQATMLADLMNQLSRRELIRVFETREAARDYLMGHDSPPPTLNNPPETSADTPTEPPTE